MRRILLSCAAILLVAGVVLVLLKPGAPGSGPINPNTQTQLPQKLVSEPEVSQSVRTSPPAVKPKINESPAPTAHGQGIPSQPPVSVTPPAKEVKKPVNSTVAKTPKVQAEKPFVKFSRPEDRGEDLSGLPLPELIHRLSESKDKIELRKVCQVLGDRSIAGKLHLDADQKAVIEKAVVGYLGQSKSKDVKVRTEAKEQIERLWWAAAPALVENITDGGDMTKAELAIKSLILMRNESIIKAVVQRAREIKEPKKRALVVFALKMMKGQRRTLIPRRKCVSEEESQRLYETLVLPALKELQPKSATP